MEPKWPLLFRTVFLLPIGLLIMTHGAAGAQDRVLSEGNGVVIEGRRPRPPRMC